MDEKVQKLLSNAYASLEIEHHEEARMYLEEALSLGAKEGALQLGWLYEQGLGVTADTDRSIGLYRTAYEYDRQQGAYYLGSLLMRLGRSEEARNFMEEASNLSHPSAAYWAYVLNVDRGTPEGIERAKKFLIRAADLGHEYAKRDLARLEMKESKSMRQWLVAFWKYLHTKCRGVRLVLKNQNDPRVR